MTNKRASAGFTLIEMIMVVVILGILSAYALPRFTEFRYEAERAAAEGALASVKAATGIVHAQAIIEGKTRKATGETVNMEGAEIHLNFGYPTSEDIVTAAGLDGFNVLLAVDKRSVIITTNKNGCKFSYYNAETAMQRPKISEITCVE